MKYPALVIGPPYGGVKEQGPGVYANQLAQRGFIVLAFDPAFMGDSGGFALSAAHMDTRIKAVATTSMYDISRAGEYFMSPEQLLGSISQLSMQRWKEAENGTPEIQMSFPAEPVDKVPEGLDPVSAEFFSFYGLKRGHHPHAGGGFTFTSNLAMGNFSSLGHLDRISPRPILLIVGQQAHSKFFSDDVYAAASEPKELCVVPDCIHIDLYDDVTKIPFDKLEGFFKENLK